MERGEGRGGNLCLVHMFMHHLNVTCHVFSHDRVAAADNAVRVGLGGGEGRLYVPPLAGLEAIPTTPVVAQTFRGVPTKITKTKNGLSATAARSGRGEEGVGSGEGVGGSGGERGGRT